jgi:hypothetical protein
MICLRDLVDIISSRAAARPVGRAVFQNAAGC